MLAHGQTVIQLFERMVPKHLAMPDDKIGLQLGTLQKTINTLLVALDVTDEVVNEAIGLGANLIIAHHAIIYRPLSNLQTDSPTGRLYEKLIKHDIAVYIAHTNYDIAEGGMNDLMAESLGLAVTAHLETIHNEPLKKLVVYVPTTHQEAVRTAIFNAGAGDIGNYSHCSFSLEGKGTFLPGEGTNAYIGQVGKLEQVDEARIETIVPQSIERQVIQSMLKAHPYEEAAYDLYTLNLKGKSFGLGRIGRLPAPESLTSLVERVKKAFDVPFVRVVGDPNREIRKVAVLGGAGSRYVRHAQFAGADVLVTGDIDYHTAHDALAAGIAIIDAGHNAEKIMKASVAHRLQQALEKNKYTTKAVASLINTEPFRFE
ncbi:MAG: Nif3-like dinuclear metal center hexameric protein [Paenibacillus sp.]|jgi:dinuclear metal center YbgI/SA1388 family protein|nr:Nif3-like dinuclear metal center hexameric protein [Paenibacillus sp.]